MKFLIATTTAQIEKFWKGARNEFALNRSEKTVIAAADKVSEWVQLPNQKDKLNKQNFKKWKKPSNQATRLTRTSQTQAQILSPRTRAVFIIFIIIITLFKNEKTHEEAAHQSNYH